MLKATLSPSLIILISAVWSVSCSPEVMESSSPYSCCGRPSFQFNQQCENTWNINGKPIAYSNGLTKECIPPCKTIEGGLMTLDECVDVNSTMVCTDEKNVAVENRIHSYSQRCSGSLSNKMAPGNQGWSVGLLLLSVVIGGLFVK